VPDDFRIPRGMPDALEHPRRTPETTVLYRAVQQNLETFLASAREQGRVVPRFVERELRAYLTCGILAHGFLRVRCDDCGRERLVAYSCKTRSCCPSCGARRMSDTAAHLVDRVFPEAPVRQYVLSLPFALRTRLAFDQTLCSEVLRIFMQAVFASLKRRARKKLTATRVYCGSVTFLQRSGGSINLNPHFHSLVLDGVYVSTVPYAPPRFTPLPPPSDEEVTRIAATIARRVEKLLVKKGFLGEHAATDRLSEAADGRILYRLQHRWRDGTTHVVFDPLDLVARLAALVPPPRANLVRYFGILAPCASWRDFVVRDRDEASSAAPPSPSCPCKPSPAPGGAPAQPAPTEDGEASLPIGRPTPPTSEQRAQGAAVPHREGQGPSSPAPLRPRRLSWAQLLRRVFAVDAFQCDCGGRMRILAAIDQPGVARAILDCLGLSSRAPPLAPASPPEPTDLELGFEEHWPSEAG
jgi:hypothetical protein